jgi:ferrous iron transport protein A
MSQIRIILICDKLPTISTFEDGTMTLDKAQLRQTRRVKAVQTSAHLADMSRQLEEIGFTPNEQVMVLTRGFPGGDPLVVRVGLSTFALRKSEAALIQLHALDGQIDANIGSHV